MTNLDIVLAKPGSQKQIYGALSDFQMTGIEPPLWGALLAAHLRGQGYGVELMDAEVLNMSPADTARAMLDLKPRVAAVFVSGSNPSASTMNMVGAGEILRELKGLAPDVPTLIMGLHPTALPERTLREEAVDFLCAGEGLVTLPALLEALRANAEPAGIPGLWRKIGEEIIPAATAPVCQDLDALPEPAWDMLPMRDYRAHNWHCFDNITARQPYAVIYTSLGCPFKCSFCCINALFGAPGIRYRSPELVAAEITRLVENYGVRNIKIMDEMFVFKRSHVLRLCELLIERGHDLNIWAYARVNTVNQELLERMKLAGVNWLAYGFESGSKRVLSDVNKGYEIDTIDRVVSMTHDAGIHICGNYIFGLPEDDTDSMKETLDLAVHINAAWANIYAAMAYPGSQLYEIAIEKGWPLPARWQDYSQYSYDSTPLPTKYLTGDQVLEFRDEAFRFYYGNKEYLAGIRAKFGVDTEMHIRKMTELRLPRRYQKNK